MALTTAQIQQAYVTFFSRPADPVGLAYWQAYTGSVADLYATFAQQTEYSAAFNGLTSAQKVNVVYQNLFGRDAEATGLLYWAGKVESGAITVANLALAVSAGSQGTDLVTVNSRVSAATSFSAALDTPAEILGYTGATANAAAKTWLAGVTTAANLATAVAAIDTATAAVVAVGGAAGSTFTLTTGVDAFTGTAQADTFSAIVGATGANASDTLSASDVLAGGAGTDTLNLTVTATNTAALNAATISGIEVINVRAAASGVTATVDASTAVGATQVNANQGPGAVTVTALANGAAIGVIGNGTVTNGTTTYAYATATADQTINIANGVKGGNITASASTGVTKATINSTGAANTVGTIDLDSAATTVTSLTVNAATDLTATLAADYAATAALVVTGAGKVNVGSAGTFKTVDASANTGGLTMAIDTVTTSFKGSTANDTITTVTLAAPAAGIIDAGAGTGDKLVVAAAADVATSGLRASYTNFEVLSNAAGASIAASDFTGVTSVESSATGGSITGLTAAQAENVAVTATQAAVTYALTTATGTSDVLGLTLGTGLTTAAATSVTGGALTVTGFETLNLKANAGPTATAGANRISTIDSFTGATLKNINLTGTSFVLGNIATTVAATIDGSALTGDGSSTSVGFTVAGSAVAGSTITGSAFADTFTIGAEGSTYNGGAGADNFSTTAAILAADGTTDLVLAGGAGSDTLTITGALTLTDNNLTNVTGMEKLATAATTSVSYTGFGAAAKTAFADGLTITSGTLADGATYTVSTGLYDKAVTLTLASSGDGATTADNIAITTGTAADTISVTASSWVGATGGAAGQLTVSTGAGNDTISVTTGTLLAITTTAPVIITGGTGKDTITTVGVNAATGLTVTYAFAAGDSLVSSYDSITGFDMGSGALFSSTLDFASVGLTTYAATAVTGNSAAELTVAVSAAGVVTFAGTKAAGLTLADKISAVQAVVTTTAGDTALFTDGGNTYVFNNNATADSVVELVGITGLSLVTANATTAGAIFIA